MNSATEVLFDWATGSLTGSSSDSLTGSSPGFSITAPRATASTGATASLFVGHDETARERRLAIYARRHLEKSMQHLRKDFEAAATALGSERYRHAVQLYLCQDQSIGPQQRWLGHRFAEFLAKKGVQEALGTTEMPWLGDLAQLDWAQSLATNAPLEDELCFSDLRQSPPEQWAHLHVTWLACVQRLDSPYNLLDVRSQSLSAPPPPSSVISRRPPQAMLTGTGTHIPKNDATAKRHWLVTRRELDIVSLELSPLEAQLFDALRYPLSLTELSDLVASHCELEEENAALQAVAWVQQWSEWGCLKPALRTSLPPCS